MDRVIKIEQSWQNIRLITEKTNYQIQDIKDLFPNEKIFVCDFALTDLNEEISRGNQIEQIGSCFIWKNVVCVDHHAPHPVMNQKISSVSLAYELRKKHPEIFTDDFLVIINHTDTDSILSALMTAGIFPPEEKWVEAGIAADHTGTENEIKSLLQSMQGERDFVLSFTNLEKLIAGAKIDKKAQSLLTKYNKKIAEAKELVQSGIFKQSGIISYALMDKGYDFVNFIGLLPDSQVLMLIYPKEGSDKLWVKIRLGQSAPNWLKLNKLKFEGEDDFGFGCRWNAGSNGRSEGTNKQPKEILNIVNRAINELKEKSN